MVFVNGKPLDWQEGLTVSKLLEIKKYTFAKIIVRVNSSLILEEDYKATLIHDSDDIQVIHLMAGG